MLHNQEWVVVCTSHQFVANSWTDVIFIIVILQRCWQTELHWQAFTLLLQIFHLKQSALFVAEINKCLVRCDVDGRDFVFTLLFFLFSVPPCKQQNKRAVELLIVLGVYWFV